MKEITKTVLYEQGKSDKLKQTDDIEEFIDVNFPKRKRNAWAKDYIYGIEINPDLAMATKVNMVGHGDGSANIYANDGLIDFEKYKDGNKLNIKLKSKVYDKFVNNQFDLVFSNPPFSITVDRETAKQFPDLYLQGDKIVESLKKDAKKEIDTEVLFIERYYHLLREEGRLGVVLPESVFDTNSNRYIRLFLYKYFWIKGVISLPNLVFAPYTQTKTSILLAQKKKDTDVIKWDKKWQELVKDFDKSKMEFEKQKKRKENKDNKKEFIKSMKDFLLDVYDAKDDKLTISELKKKYEEDIKQMDVDWWVFNKISQVFNYDIFFAHADEVGYKRGANKIETRPNELFQEEIVNGFKTMSVDITNPKTILDFFINKIKW